MTANDRARTVRCKRCRWPMLPSLYGWVCESPVCFPTRYAVHHSSNSAGGES